MRLVPRLLVTSGLAPALVAVVARAEPIPPPAALPVVPAPPSVMPPAPPAPLIPPGEMAPAAPATSSGPAPELPPASEPAPSGAETLEAPYAEPAPSPPQTPAEPGANHIKLSPQDLASDTRPRPIRAIRRVALLGEVGWNSLAGFGAIVTYHATPHWSLDMGGGFSLLGWKAGVRPRYNFTTDDFTPFIGAGFNATSGLGKFSSDPKDDPHPEPDAKPYTYEVKASYLASAVVGFELVRPKGFTMQAAVGYARLLNSDNTRLVDGSLTPTEQKVLDVIFKSGPVISLAFGSTFK